MCVLLRDGAREGVEMTFPSTITYASKMGAQNLYLQKFQQHSCNKGKTYTVDMVNMKTKRNCKGTSAVLYGNGCDRSVPKTPKRAYALKVWLRHSFF